MINTIRSVHAVGRVIIASRQIDDTQLKDMLLSILPSRTVELSNLLDELNLVWIIEDESDGNLFQAELGEPNKIRIGLKCSKRLQAHAYATAVVFSSLGKPEHERDQILAPVDELMNWAVGTDITRWLDKRGVELPHSHPLRADDNLIPDHVLSKIGEVERVLGAGFYRYAVAWILLHELGHLELGHSRKKGLPSLEQEKDADRFAADWLVEASNDSEGEQRDVDRLSVLFGAVVALIWVTVFNVYFGRSESETHPEGYDRLFQVLDYVVDPSDKEECFVVWESVATMLFIHMGSAGYEFDESDASCMGIDSREEASYLIDRISKFDRKR